MESVTKQQHQDKKARLLRAATIASVVTSLTLVIIKLVAWLMTSSVGILASLIDSVMDVLASVINFFAVWYSLQPADNEHRFGHGKAEPLAALAQATFIAGSAVFLLLHAVDRILHPHAVSQISVGVAVMLFSIFLTLVLVSFQRYVIRHTGSTAIQADSVHYVADIMTNAGTIIALVLVFYGWPVVDPLIALLIGGYILYHAGHIGREAFHLLMDRELSPAIQSKIEDVVLSSPGVKGFHDLRTRQSGQVSFIQIHIELDDHLPLIEAHAISDLVEARICVAVPGAEVIIHEDPVSVAST